MPPPDDSRTRGRRRRLPTPGESPAAAPSIRQLARDLGIDLTRVRGSERGGRIVLEDVRAYIQRLQRLAAEPRAAAPAAAPAAAKPAPEHIDFSKWGPVSKKPLSPLRQVIARRMTENWNTVPHVTQFDRGGHHDLMALRKKYAPPTSKRRAAHAHSVRAQGGRRHAQEASGVQFQPG